jgi:murein endopeptidase
VRRAVSILVASALTLPAGALAQVPGEEPAPSLAPAKPAAPSKAIGKPWNGRLVNAVQLPEAGPGFLTWDDPLNRMPNRPDRRWGTTALLRTTKEVLARYQEAHPGALPVLVGDLSRPQGGVFDERYGGLGHASHQNGLDVDVYYPRLDRRLRSAWRPEQVDRVLAQDLVDRFVAAGAQRVFVGPRVGLRGPRGIVARLAHHDDHLHVRIPNPG